MRSDMAKVIVERPRVGGRERGDYRLKNKSYDDLPSKESMRSRHVRNHGGKNLNENLQPLRRYLQSCVGRPWNKVYSEICENLKTTSTVQQHVRDHVDDFVKTDAMLVTPSLDCPTGVMASWRNGGGRDYAVSADGLYVHPKSGLLLKARNKITPRKRQRYYDTSNIERRVGDHYLAKLGGIWYSYKLEPFTIDVWYDYDLVEQTYRGGKRVIGTYTQPIIRLAPKIQRVRKTAYVIKGQRRFAVQDSLGQAIRRSIGQSYYGYDSFIEPSGAPYLVRRYGGNFLPDLSTRRQLSSADLKRNGLAND